MSTDSSFFSELLAGPDGSTPEICSSFDSFHSHYYHKPYHVDRSGSSFTYLRIFEELSYDEIFRHSNRRDLTPANISLSKQSDVLPASAFCYSAKSGDFPVMYADMDKVSKYFGLGYTVLFEAMEMSIPFLARFSKRLSDSTFCRVGLTGFYTPASNQGFKAHYDDVDVFVMQLHGSKVWEVYDAGLVFATSTADCDVSGISPVLRVELHPGDLLFIPRGLVHKVYCTDKTSFHISASLSPYTVGDAFRYLMGFMENNVAFRKPIPFSYHKHWNMRSDFIQAINELISDHPQVEVLTEMANRLIDHNYLISNSSKYFLHE